jgi:hypothetical protein
MEKRDRLKICIELKKVAMGVNWEKQYAEFEALRDACGRNQVT